LISHIEQVREADADLTVIGRAGEWLRK